MHAVDKLFGDIIPLTDADRRPRKTLDQLLAERPVNETGAPLCVRCEAVEIGAQVFHCKPCADLEREESIQRDREREEQERLEQWRADVWASIESFPSWEHATIGTPQFAAAVKVPAFRRAAERYTPERGNVVLVGPTGTGKTTAITAIARAYPPRIIERGRDPRDDRRWKRTPDGEFIGDSYFLRCAELARAMRRHPLGAERECDELERALSCRLLCLDDLGNEPPGFERTLLEVMDERYERALAGNKVWTFVTSGFRVEELEQRYGSALVRRLTDPRGTILDAWEAEAGGR